MPTLILQLQILQNLVVMVGATGQSYVTIRWLMAYRDSLIPTTTTFISNVTGALALINPVYTKNYNPTFLADLVWVQTASVPLLLDIFEKLKTDTTASWSSAASELQVLLNNLTWAYTGCVETSVWGRGLPDVPFDLTAIAGTLANVMGLIPGVPPLPFLPSESALDAGIGPAASADGPPAVPVALSSATSAASDSGPSAPTTPPGPVMSIVAGDGQSVPRTGTMVPGGIASFAALTVKLRDAQGNPIANQTVNWSSPSHPQQMAVQMDPGGYPFTTTTDANGESQLNRMGGKAISAYYADGPFTIMAQADGVAATFHLAVGQPPPPQMSIVSGDGQAVARSGSEVPGGTAYFAPLTVQLRDGSGNPLPNQTVTWSSPSHPAPMAVQMDPGGYPFSTATDGEGRSVLNRMGGSSVRTYYATGDFTIMASSGGASATFHLKAT